jgi:hypothetical protein
MERAAGIPSAIRRSLTVCSSGMRFCAYSMDEAVADQAISQGKMFFSSESVREVG